MAQDGLCDVRQIAMQDLKLQAFVPDFIEGFGHVSAHQITLETVSLIYGDGLIDVGQSLDSPSSFAETKLPGICSA